MHNYPEASANSLLFSTLECLDVGLDDDVLRYVKDFCSLMNDHNNNNSTCQLADGNNIHTLRPNVSAPARMPCTLPPTTVESSSQREQRSFHFVQSVNFGVLFLSC